MINAHGKCVAHMDCSTQRHIRGGVEVNNNNCNHTPTHATPTSSNDQHHHNENGYHHLEDEPMPVPSQKQNGYLHPPGGKHSDQDEESVLPKMNGLTTAFSLEEGDGTTPLTFTMYPN